MAPRKKKSRSSGKNRWIWVLVIALIAAGFVIVIALNIPLHLQPSIPAPVKSVTTTPKRIEKSLDLGSFGVTVSTPSGKNMALTIHPVAILQGQAPWHPLPAAQHHFDSLVANPFMAFPDLQQIPHSTAAQKILADQILNNIRPTLQHLEPGWTIQIIELHPALQAIPSGDA